jgi:hypothetical protein
MCQGLPCLRATVRLRVARGAGPNQVPAGSVGEVTAEHLAAREISVDFFVDDRIINIRLPEALVDLIR